jgi:hypothetical protein
MLQPEKVGAWLDQCEQILTKLSLLSNLALVLLSCLMLGYLLKSFRRFPNDAIPLAVVFWAIIATFCTAPPTPQGTPVVAWKVRSIMLGVIVGYASWGIHYWVLSWIEDKIPVLRDFFSRKTENKS